MSNEAKDERVANKGMQGGDGIREVAKNAQLVGLSGVLRRGNARGVLDTENPTVKEEILQMISSYLLEEGYTCAAMMLQDEGNVRKADVRREESERRQRGKLVKRAIIEGEWAEVEKFCSKSSIRSMKNFLYCVYKQQYLELVDRQEYQKAFTYLTKKLKPYEGHQSHPEEFRNLCYLLTCKSISDVEKEWDGIAAARNRLAGMFGSLMTDSEMTDKAGADGHIEAPPGRLLELLEQAVEFQISSSRYQPRFLPPITSLLRDYECFVLPNALAHEYHGHGSNIKCVDFLGQDGDCLVSGSSDQTIRIWCTGMPQCGSVRLEGHNSRVWDLHCSATEPIICSASGDATVRLWNVERKLDIIASGEPLEGHVIEPAMTLSGHSGDVYACRFHKDGGLVASGGYDKTVRLWDVEKGAPVRCFYGHEASVTCVGYNEKGNLAVSGSKDGTVRFWDVLSGLLVNSLPGVGDVTSLDTSDNGLLLLTASKGNSNRIWDLRKIAGGDNSKQSVKLYKGHQNTSSNHIRARFGPAPNLFMSGSEDGYAYLWDRETGAIVQRLGGLNSVLYSAVWSTRQSLLATCSHDGILRTWWYDETKPIEFSQPR